jgi:hypothetical protein
VTRWERFFFWLGRINAVGIFLLLVFATGTIAIGFYQGYQYRQELEDEKFGNEVADSGPYSGDSIEVPGGEIAAYYQKERETFDRREGSDITLVDPRTGKTRRIAGGDDDAWVLNWELIFRDGEEGGTAIGYLARITDEERYAAGRFDLVVGNFPALEQKVVARDLMGVDLPIIAGEAGAAFIMWSELDKAVFVAVDLRDLSITTQREIPLPVVRENELTQGSGPRTSLRQNAFEAAPRSVFAEQ